MKDPPPPPPPPSGSSGAPPEGEKKPINSELWHACAGPLVSLPPEGSLVVYFPQGHSEQVAASMHKELDTIPNYPSLPSKLICWLQSCTLHADPETDEVYAQMTLQPVNKFDRDAMLASELGLKQNKQPTEFFCKALTASDTSTHGGFSVPRRAAEKIFPTLDFTMQPPAQELVAKDLHDSSWKFRHIYRGQPKRHLLTTGWSVFVSAKRLLAGDSVLFIRDEKSQLLLGIRRANRPQPALSSSVLSSDSMHIGILAAAAHAAANNSPFTIFYNPRASPSEFVVPLAKYNKALYAQVSPGMRFRMLFETEDSGVRRYMGTITSISDIDPIRWKKSHWRSLQVGWDESTGNERRTRVSLWEIEPVATPFYICPPSFIRPNLSNQQGIPDDESEVDSSFRRAMPWLADDFGLKDVQNAMFPGLNLVQWMAMKQNPQLLQSMPQSPCLPSSALHMQNAISNITNADEAAQQVNPQAQALSLPQNVAAVQPPQPQPMLSQQQTAQLLQQIPIALQQQQQASLVQHNSAQLLQQQNARQFPRQHGSQKLQHQQEQLQQQQQEAQPPPQQQQQQPKVRSVASLEAVDQPKLKQQKPPNDQLLNQIVQPSSSQLQRVSSLQSLAQYQGGSPQSLQVQQLLEYELANLQNQQQQIQQLSQSELQVQFLQKLQQQQVLSQMSQQQQSQFIHQHQVAQQQSFNPPVILQNHVKLAQRVSSSHMTGSLTPRLVSRAQSIENDLPSCSTAPSMDRSVTMLSPADRSQQGGGILTNGMPIMPIESLLQETQSRADARPRNGIAGGKDMIQFPNRNPSSDQLDASSATSFCLDESAQEGFSMPHMPINVQPDPRDSFILSDNVDGLIPDALFARQTATGRGLGSFPTGPRSHKDVETELSSAAFSSQSFGMPDISFKAGCSSDAAIPEAGLPNHGIWNNSHSQRMRTYTKVQKRGSVGRSIDVTRYRGYDELRHDLASMFGIQGQLEDPHRTEWKLVYVDHENDILLVGDDPWEEFVSCVKSIKILSAAEVQQMSLDGDLGGISQQHQACSASDEANVWRNA